MKSLSETRVSKLWTVCMGAGAYLSGLGCSGTDDTRMLQSNTAAEPIGQLRSGIRVIAGADPSTDVAGVRVSIRACGDSTVVAGDSAGLQDAIPSAFGEGANQPFAANSEHIYADVFQVLPPGCYDVLAEPTTASGDASSVCVPALKTGVSVVQGQSAELVVLIQCPSPDAQALDVVAGLNHEPQINSVSFADSKFFCGAAERICADALDIDLDPVELVLSAPPSCSVVPLPRESESSACFDLSCEVPSKVELLLTAYDLLQQDGVPVRIEDFLASEGYPSESHSSLSFFAYSTSRSFFTDADGDGFGDQSLPPTPSCESTPPPGSSDNNQDCDDANDSINPSATEVCGNGTDDDCNGQVDEGCSCVGGTALDVVLFQDLSGSFSDDLQFVQASAPVLFDALTAAVPSTHMGVASFVDKPLPPFGAADDYVFQIEGGGALTADRGQFLSAINGMVLRFGDDEPESQIEGLMHIGTHSSELGYRADARKFVILMTDAPFHEAGDCIAQGACTEPNDGDPNIELLEDYPTLERIAGALAAADVTPIFAVTPGNEPVYASLVDNLAALGARRGRVVTLALDSSNLVQAVLEGLSIGSQTPFFPDADGDGFGDSNAEPVLGCGEPPLGFSDNAADCDDARADVNPGEPEVCGDRRDNDCNAVIDDGCPSLGLVGYYDMQASSGVQNQVPPILTAGGTPEAISSLDLEALSSLDVLVVQNPNNEGYGSAYIAALPQIEAAVEAGLVLIIHDRFVEPAESILPGGASFDIIRDFSDDANIDVLDDTTVLTHGPGGTVDDTTLDFGSSSSHGFAVTGTLPGPAVRLLSRGAPDEIVTFCYQMGAGAVVYSTIPLDYYLENGSVSAFASVYAPNMVAYGLVGACESRALE